MGPPQAAGAVRHARQSAHSLLSRGRELQDGLLGEGRRGDQEHQQDRQGRTPVLHHQHRRQQQALAQPHHREHRHVSITI